jgi:hypothetical protein
MSTVSLPVGQFSSERCSVASRSGFGFRFLLIHPDGEPADPAMCVTASPSWKVGNEFLAGPELVKFRTSTSTPNRHPGTHGVFSVEAVSEQRRLGVSSLHLRREGLRRPNRAEVFGSAGPSRRESRQRQRRAMASR